MANSENNNEISSPEREEALPDAVDIHYLKTNSYRSYHADGVFGGITPSGKLYIELFIQRAVTPQIVTHKIKEDGSLGEEVHREGKTGIIREIEAGIILDINVARTLPKWLGDKIKFYEDQLSSSEEQA
jgi:hypothetical protein